jgi:hypothetical protein
MNTYKYAALELAILESLVLQKDTISLNGGIGSAYFVGTVEVTHPKDEYAVYAYMLPIESTRDGKLRGTYKRVDKNGFENSLSYAHCSFEVSLSCIPNQVCGFDRVTLYL